MPTYQYSCTECGHFLEQFQSFTDDALTECPVCGGRLRKVFNAVGVVFKGSGFYRNDSRGADKGSGGGSDGGDKTETKKSDGGETKTGSEKPAAAKESSGSSEKKTSTTTSSSTAAAS